MSLLGKSAVVTGGAGFIGSHVVDALVAAGARVTVVDNLSTGFREFVAQPGVELVVGDLLDAPLLDRVLSGKDIVFHLAANADIKEGLRHPRRDVEQNLLATQNVLEAMRANGVRRIVFTSTGSVYGEPEVFPTPEDCPFPVQTSLYAASKVACEGLLTAYAFGYGIQCHIFRLVSALGPRYSHGHVFDFFRKLTHDKTRLDVLGDGHQRKSYLHVSDLVAALFVVLERTEAPIQIFNVGSDEWIEVNDSIRIICRELGVTPAIRYSGGARGWVGDSPKILLDTKRLRALGWAPRRNIEDSIQDTLRYLRDHPLLLRREGREMK